MARLTSLLALIALSLAPAAHAVDAHGTHRWAPGTRAESVAHPATQQRLNRSAAWQDFEARHGAWTALWDEATQRPARFWGEGWDVAPEVLADDAALADYGFAILASERDLLGVDVTDLRPLVVARADGITTVTYAQDFRGVPVHDARISLSFKAGRFVVGQFESMSAIAAQVKTVSPALSRDDAVKAALAGLRWAWEDAEVPAADLVIAPLLSEVDATYRLAWKVEARALHLPAHRIVLVDAATGELLAWEEQVRFFSAAVKAEVDDRYPQQGLVEAPMVNAQLDSDALLSEVDANGQFEFDASTETPVSWGPGSRWFRVRDHGPGLASWDGVLGSATTELVAAPSPELDDTSARRVRAQLDAHVSAHMVRDRAIAINPGFPWAADRANVHVNKDDTACNAWFDGEINFVRQSDQCNNSARVRDVVFHEYGHGFHMYSIVQGAGAFDGALGEGLGDYMAATITGDPATARGFYRNSTQPLRDIAPNHVWPDDVGEIHYSGIIIAGTLWDLRQALVAQYGEEEGIEHADRIFWHVARLSTDIPTAYVSALLADDDNGDLADGTPNKCTIDEQFALHGLGDAADVGGLFEVSHVAPTEVEAEVDVAIGLHVGLARPDCTEGSVGTVRVHYSYDSDDVADFDVVELSGEGNLEARLPGGPAGALLRYTIEVLDPAGVTVGSEPKGSITDPWFGVVVGQMTELYFEDFEADDGGYTSDLLAGDPERDGANDWGHGTPQGDAGDPDGCYSGDGCWGNDVSPEENWNGAYQRDVHNILYSPVVSVGDVSELHLQYRRWLTIEDGVFDNAIVRVNGVEVWRQHASSSQDGGAHHEDSHWALRSYDISGLVDGGEVQISWELQSDSGLQMGGWNIDDVRLVGSAVAAPALDEGLVDGDGCQGGCSTGASGSAGWLVLLLLPLVRRRR